MNRLIAIALVLLTYSAFAQEIKLSNLHCDYRINPHGVGTVTPRLSWELVSSHRGVMQSAYRILVSEDTPSLKRSEGTVWDSQKKPSTVSIGTAYAGPTLAPGHTYYWKVMVWDQQRNDSSHWSPIASWQTGLLAKLDWKNAQWIGYEALPDSSLQLPAPSVKGIKKNGPFRDTLPLFRREFEITKPLLRATAFVSGLGHFELRVNGEKTGDHFLDPGWVAYDKKALYVALDLTPQLRQGANAIGVMLGNGFYYIPKERYRKLLTAYGYPKLIARIVLEYTDGTTEDIVTDPSWKTAPGPITFSSIYGGEDYDARREQAGWDSPHFDESRWLSAIPVSGPPVLEAQSAEPLKVFEHFTARRMYPIRPTTTVASSRSWIYDLGQNASGIIQLRVSGRKGAVVRIIPAELLDADSSASQKATGKPYYWEYILKGDGIESWQPRFTYYGFRYLQLEGAVPAGEPNPDNLPVVEDISGLHTRNAMERTGKFTCSNELFRRIDTLIDWAIQSNIASVFTDCPHREKLGWLEEAHLMGNSMRYGYDIGSLYRKIIRDMEDAQTPDGLIPEIAPEFTVFGDPFRDSPEWGSSSVLVPWYLYLWYGDKTTLTEAWPMMQRYMHYLAGETQDHLLYEGLGDWYDIGPQGPGYSQLTPKGVTASAIYYHDLTIMTRIAVVLGENGDEYAREAAYVKKAFDEKFFDAKTGEVASGSQTANAMALYTDILPDRYRDTVLANIVKDLRERHNSLTAGDIGFRYLLKALDQGHRADLIFDMNSRTDVPGYGFQLAKGATALTESWQAFGSVSNDHLMLGHIMEWFYDGLAGITSPETAGSAPGASDAAMATMHWTIRPEPVGNIQWAQADYHSPYGLISSHWKRSATTFDLDVSIPANTTATVYLPAKSGAVITEGWKRIDLRTDVRLVKQDSGWAVFEIGSGNYNFRSTTGNAVSEKEMAAIYEQIKTPYKYGLVVTGADKSKKLDCPTIFRKGDSWFMSYIIFDGRGYETWLAKSPDLLHWTTLGRMLSFSDTTGADSNRWDANQKAGYVGLEDLTWGGSYRLQQYGGKYWMSYFGGNTRGYEAGMLSEGMAFTDKDPSIPHEWKRLDHPILTPRDPGVGWWDDHTMYKSWVVWDKHQFTGHPFLLYYNANGDSLDKRRGSERIGMAVSDDMIHWTRPSRNPLLDHLTGITGDPYIQKIGDLYVLFYFGAFWHGTHGAFNRFACSYDLIHWTDWTGPDLIESSEAYDEVFAHKSFVINFKGTVYHFYCAVDKKGNRGIALATSTDKGKSASGRVNFDAAWQFHLGADTADATWRMLDLPHDWSIEGPFSDKNASGQQEAGLPAGIGWYRKTFQEPAGDKVYIDFDGIYRNSDVWINGHLLGHRPNGYISFRYELTPWLNSDKPNVIVVKVDNSAQPNSRWYSGSGIYRHVWLEKKGPVSIDPADVFITTPAVDEHQARVHIEMPQNNGCAIRTTLFDAANQKLSTSTGQDLMITEPRPWSPDDPYLYRVEIQLLKGDDVLDTYTTQLGIRSFRFDSQKGFFLNGQPLKIKGVCLHHDLGALGAAVNAAAIVRQLHILKEMGCNAIRTSHNPPAPELLDACDSLGFLVMDEAFDMWQKKKTKYDYSQDFRQWHQKDLQDQIRRDRNHPSVIVWSIGNEIREQFDSSGIPIARELAAIVKALDTTRPITSALTETDTTKNFIYRSGALDLIGLNYNEKKYDSVPVKYPGHPFIATETTSALETRGHYDMPSDSIRRWPPGAKQPLVGANPDYTVSAYDNVSAYWGSTHEETWKAAKRDPWVSGIFVWTGFDYLGEPTPYPWPARSSYFGILDLAGFPKDVYYMYQSEWATKPVLHVFPAWNGRPGEPIDIWAYYNEADEVELFLNGRSLGTRKKQGDQLHVEWKGIPFQPGELKAVSTKDGTTVVTQTIHTAGAPAVIRLEADRKILHADGSDLSFITIRITDAAGNLVPHAANDLRVAISGPGTLVAMDNGYQADLESFQAPHHKAYNGLLLAIIRTKKQAGKIRVQVSGKGLRPADIIVSCI